jgi:hypothetical protein
MGSNYELQPNKPPVGMSIASMVLGICSLPTVLCIYSWVISVPCAIVGLILGLIARGKIRTGEASGAGMATTGIVCSIVSLSLAVGGVILLIAGFSLLAHSFNRMQANQPHPNTPYHITPHLP